jgi:hypothetical protein
MKLWPSAGAAPRMHRFFAVALTVLALHLGGAGFGFAVPAAEAAGLWTHHATAGGGISPATVEYSPAYRLAPRRPRPQHPCEECPPAHSNR